MSVDVWGVNLYVLNFALLFTHQIDSAYWREWDLFHLPGGVQLNLVLNFVLLMVALIGFTLLLQAAPLGYLFALVLASGGVFAFGIHSYFLLRGNPAFRLPASIAVLVGTLLVSIVQGALAIRAILA